MATITKNYTAKRLDFDTIYGIRIRTHWRGLTGEWGETLYYKTIGEDDIPAPTGVTLDFDKKGADKHNRWNCIATWNETLLPDCTLGVDEYIVQLWIWDRKNNALLYDNYERRKKVPAKDEADRNDICRAKFFPIAKKRWWVARVRAVVNGVKGPWSAWSAPGSPMDTDPPPNPMDVTIIRGVNRIITTWREPSEFAVLNGTVTASAGTNTLSGSGTAFDTEVGEGVYIRLGTEIKTVIDVTSPTSLTVDSNWGSSYTNVYYEVDITEDSIAKAEVQMSKDQNFATIEDQDRRVFAQKKSFKAEDEVLYYTRVRFVDSSGVKGKWVNATRSGNSDPDIDAEGRKPKNLEQIATFSVGGALTVKSYNMRWYADHDYVFKSVNISAGTAPTGNNILVQVYVNGSAIFTNANRPSIGAGNHRGKSTDFAIDGIDDGDYLTISVDSIGSGVAGEDLSIQVRMGRDN